jgi:hypothetical protein
VHKSVIRSAITLLVSVAAAAAVAPACSKEPDVQDGTQKDAGAPDADADAFSTDGEASADVADQFVLDASDLPKELGWLADPAAWKSVDGVTLEDCQLLEALPGKLPLSPIPWKSCGTGCEELAPQQTLIQDLYLPTASTHRVGGETEVFLAGEQAIKGSSLAYGVRRVIRLRDGITLGAVQRVMPLGIAVSPCYIGTGGESALHSGVIGGTPSIVLELTGPRTPDDAWGVARPPLLLDEAPAALIEFDNDHAGGQKFAIGKGSVWGLLDVDKSEWTLLESNSSSWHGSGEGDLAVWADFGIDRVRGWAPDGQGVRTLLENAPSPTCDVVPTPTHIVGFVPVAGATCDTPSKGRIWHFPRSNTLTTLPPSVSPELPGLPTVLVASYGIRAWGDFAVLHLSTFDQFPTYLLVIQLSTWKTWRVDAQADLEIQGDTFTLDDTHLYFGEGPKGDADVFLSRMRRLELDLLDSAPNVTSQ